MPDRPCRITDTAAGIERLERMAADAAWDGEERRRSPYPDDHARIEALEHALAAMEQTWPDLPERGGPVRVVDEPAREGAFGWAALGLAFLAGMVAMWVAPVVWGWLA